MIQNDFTTWLQDDGALEVVPRLAKAQDSLARSVGQKSYSIFHKEQHLFKKTLVAQTYAPMIPTIGESHVPHVLPTVPGQDRKKTPAELPLEDEAQRAARDGVLTQLRPDELASAEPLQGEVPTEMRGEDLANKFDLAAEPEALPTAAVEALPTAAATPVEETAILKSAEPVESTLAGDKAEAINPQVFEIQDQYC